MCGVCTIPGWQGGLALLSNLERSPMASIMLRGLPAQGGFEAAYYGGSLSGSQRSGLWTAAAHLRSVTPFQIVNAALGV